MYFLHIFEQIIQKPVSAATNLFISLNFYSVVHVSIYTQKQIIEHKMRVIVSLLDHYTRG